MIEVKIEVLEMNYFIVVVQTVFEMASFEEERDIQLKLSLQGFSFQ